MPDGNFVPVLRRSEPKIVYFTLVLFAIFKWFCFLLYRISFNIDSTERTSRANIFASTTAYANLFIYMGNRQPVFIRHHCDSLRGTVFRAGPTTSSVCINDAIFLDKNNISHLCKMFLLYTYRKNSPVRTNISANSTIKIAESFLETDGRLHYSCQAILHESWLQYMRWAFADTKMARCTLLLKMFTADRPRRSNRILFFVYFFTSQTCNGFFNL